MKNLFWVIALLFSLSIMGCSSNTNVQVNQSPSGKSILPVDKTISISGGTVSNSVPDTNSDVGNAKLLVGQFAETINNNDVDNYISLFTASNQEEMKSYIERNGKTNFFGESHIELTNTTKLTDNVGKRSASMSNEEIEKYSDIVVYYVEMNQEIKDGSHINDDYILDSGFTYRVYVIVKENDEWKISKVSFPNIEIIVNADEGFGTDCEKAKMEEQKAKTHAN